MKLIRILLLMLATGSLSSCAVLMHSPSDNIYIDSTEPGTRISIEQAGVKDRALPADIVVPRSSKTLQVKITTPTGEGQAFIPARRSGFIAGNAVLFPYLTLPGLLIDYTHKTRSFNYKRRVLLSHQNGYWALSPRRDWPYPPKFALELGIPVFSHHIHAVRTGTRYSSNVLGAELAVRYHYNQKRFVRLGGGVNSSLPIFAPDWFELLATEDRTLSAYLRLQHGWAAHPQVYLSAGIQATYYEHLIESNNDDFGFFFVNRFDRDSDSWQLGPVLSADFLTQSLVGFGLHYAPSFYSLSQEKIRFAHSMQAVVRLNIFP